MSSADIRLCRGGTAIRLPGLTPWRITFIALLLVGLPFLAALLVNALLPPPGPDAGDVCSRYCHNHNCPHGSVLPAWLSSDHGWYGRTIRLLLRAGRGSGAASGYLLVNVLVFCLAWPLAILILLVLVLRQRLLLQQRESR